MILEKQDKKIEKVLNPKGKSDPGANVLKQFIANINCEKKNRYFNSI